MRDWAKVGILVCVSLGLIGGLCEVGLRLLEGVELKGSSEDKNAPKTFMRQDDILEWVPRKGARQEGSDPYGQQYMVRINDSGQRGAEIEPRQQRERRILFLGDSFTIGSSLREADLFVPQIGQLLHERTERPIQTINAGVDGYNTLQEMGYYHLYGRSLKPDIVVLCFFAGNDFRDNAVNTNRGKVLNPVLVPAAIREKYLDPPDPFLRGQEDRLLLDPLPFIERAFTYKPALIQAGMEAALLHGETGEFAKAIALLEKVVLQAPQWVDAWVNLGAYYARNGAYEKARAAQMQALTLFPTTLRRAPI